MRGNLADLAATGLASEPTLRKWIAAQPDQPWIIRRGSNGVDYEIDIPGAIEAFRAEEEKKAQAARDRAAAITQIALDFGITVPSAENALELSIAERRQLLEEEVVAIKLSRLRGELVPVTSVQAAFGDVLIRFRDLGRTFSARLSKRVDLTREQITAIDRMVEADQAKLAAMLEGLEGELDHGDTDGDGDEDPGAAVAHPALQDGR